MILPRVFSRYLFILDFFFCKHNSPETHRHGLFNAHSKHTTESIESTGQFYLIELQFTFNDSTFWFWVQHVQVNQRSVGIQLDTVQSPAISRVARLTKATPSFKHAKREFSYYLGHKISILDLCDTNSVMSLAATEADFEYDYYEEAMPGSYLIPTNQVWLID